MPYGSDVIYAYDGTFDGLMCCVFESYTAREIPADIICGEEEQLTFAEVKTIFTDRNKALRIIRSIPAKMGNEALYFIKKAFLSCRRDKDMLILKFMYKGYRYGERVMSMLADDTVNALNKAVFYCAEEAHKLLGFVRFTDTGEALAAVIEPKNTVLPLIAAHFTDRLRNEKFLIYDKTHRMALIYADHRAEIAANTDFSLPVTGSDEEQYRRLWKTFYDAVSIKERYNPKCRMTLMPKRYWENMPEMQDEITKSLNVPRPSGLDTLYPVPGLPD